jgi:RHS repeat-associated protein
VEYVDAPIIRYRDGNTDGDVLDEGDSSLYYLHDANFNVTGLVDKAETAVVERYMYEPYGDMKVLDADWGEDANNTSDFDNEVLYAGYRRDAESALYHVRHRYYHPTLGRWLSRDPLGYREGLALYQYTNGCPLSGSDPQGLYFECNGLYIGECPSSGGNWERQPRTPPPPSPPPLPWSFDAIMREAETRRGRGRWGDSAQHCWAACYITVRYGYVPGWLAMIVEDWAERNHPVGDWRRDIEAQHYGWNKGQRAILCLGPKTWFNADTACDDMCDSK